MIAAAVVVVGITAVLIRIAAVACNVKFLCVHNLKMSQLQPVVVLRQLYCSQFMWIDITPQLWCDAIAEVAATAILRPHHMMWSAIWIHDQW